MSAHANPDIVTDGLVFGFDTGYPFVSESHETFRYNRGEPTTTFDIGTMVPTSPTTYFTSNSVYHSNLHGTAWDWSYYPNSNISTEGGMEWVPNYEGPGFTGAWKMKKRAGGNSESNFSGIAPGTIDSSKTYTVSVWCKTDQATMARIHLNTTKSGSSYWGYASGYHSGGGGWERLSVTIPAGAGNTSLNTIRCQCLGTTTNADAYWRDYQVEERGHATPFILGGTRSATGSLIDLTGTNDIDVSDVSFDSNAQMTFDGTDDYISIPTYTFGNGSWTLNAWVNPNVVSGYNIMSNSSGGPVANAFGFNGGKIHYRNYDGVWRDHDGNTTLPVNNWYMLTWVNYEGASASDGTMKMYVNGVADSDTFNSYTTNGGPCNAIGRNWTSSFYNGKIPQVSINTKSLSDAEVRQNFNATKSRFQL
jgi:hypothetical protein